MAPRKQVRSLRNTAINKIGAYLQYIFRNLLVKNAAASECSDVCERLKEYFYGNTPPGLHNEIGQLCMKVLEAGYHFIGSCFSGSDEIFSQLACIIVSPRLEELKPRNHSGLDPIGRSLYKQHHQMIGIRDLDFSFISIVALNNRSEEIVIKWATFSNLVSFSFQGWGPFNDKDMKAICENCKELRTLKVATAFVTDECIASLIRCKKLESVNLQGTRVTSKGYCRLLIESNSDTLTDLELGSSTAETLKLLSNSKSTQDRTFKLKSLKLDGCYLAEYGGDVQIPLEVIARFFPNLEAFELSLYREVPDLSTLIGLQKLTSLHFNVVSNLYTTHHRLSNFFTKKGSDITSLMLHTRSIDDGLSPRVLSDICRLCPNLATVDIDVYYKEGDPAPTPTSSGGCKPFQNLQTFRIKYPLSLAKSILCQAPNIRRLHFVQCYPNLDRPDLDEFVTDKFFEEVLEFNSLSCLEYIEFEPDYYDEDLGLSAEILKRMIRECRQLKCIKFSNLVESSTSDIDTVKKFIKANNFDVSCKSQSLYDELLGL